MTRLATLALIVSLLAFAVPAAADTEPVLLAPCTLAEGETAVTPGPDGQFSEVVETPVGALNVVGLVEVGTFVVDLAGLPEDTRRTATMTLGWDNPVSDYDLVVNGANDFGTDNPEVKSLTNRAHCARIDLATDVFVGVPIDVLTLTVRVA